MDDCCRLEAVGFEQRREEGEKLGAICDRESQGIDAQESKAAMIEPQEIKRNARGADATDGHVPAELAERRKNWFEELAADAVVGYVYAPAACDLPDGFP
jgi:hypothetical protein